MYQAIQLGDILYSSWGDTNIDFYEVTKIVSAKTVVIRKVASETIDETTDKNLYSMSAKKIACPGKYVGEPMSKRVSDGLSGKIIKLNSYSHCSLWNNKPLFYSWDS